jgi:hypothetical protein
MLLIYVKNSLINQITVLLVLIRSLTLVFNRYLNISFFVFFFRKGFVIRPSLSNLTFEERTILLLTSSFLNDTYTLKIYKPL